MRILHSDLRLPQEIANPDRWFVIVQTESPTWTYDDLTTYLSYQSPTNPTEKMFRVESRDASITGHSSNVLISCSMEDHEWVLKDNHDESTRRARGYKNDGKGNIDGVTVGSPIEVTVKSSIEDVANRGRGPIKAK